MVEKCINHDRRISVHETARGYDFKLQQQQPKRKRFCTQRSFGAHLRDALHRGTLPHHTAKLLTHPSPVRGSSACKPTNPSVIDHPLLRLRQPHGSINRQSDTTPCTSGQECSQENQIAVRHLTRACATSTRRLHTHCISAGNRKLANHTANDPRHRQSSAAQLPSENLH